MKRKHRIPPEAYWKTEPVTPEYQAEVDRSMARGAERERRAQRRLAAAEARLQKAQRIKAKPQRVQALLVARELVELRRQELLAIQREMNTAPASAEHRTKRGRHRPVLPMETF